MTNNIIEYEREIKELIEKLSENSLYNKTVIAKVVLPKVIETTINEITTEINKKVNEIEKCKQLLGTDNINTTKTIQTVEPVKVEELVSVEIQENEIISNNDSRIFDIRFYDTENKKEGTKIKGYLEYEGQTYIFMASKNMPKPIVYGTNNRIIFDICKDLIIKNYDKTFFYTPMIGDAVEEYRFYNNFDTCTNPKEYCYIYKNHLGQYKGYLGERAFCWDIENHKLPSYNLWKHLMDTKFTFKNGHQAYNSILLFVEEVKKYEEKLLTEGEGSEKLLNELDNTIKYIKAEQNKKRKKKNIKEIKNVDDIKVNKNNIIINPELEDFTVPETDDSSIVFKQIKEVIETPIINEHIETFDMLDDCE